MLPTYWCLLIDLLLYSGWRFRCCAAMIIFFAADFLLSIFCFIFCRFFFDCDFSLSLRHFFFSFLLLSPYFATLLPRCFDTLCMMSFDMLYLFHAIDLLFYYVFDIITIFAAFHYWCWCRYQRFRWRWSLLPLMLSFRFRFHFFSFSAVTLLHAFLMLRCWCCFILISCCYAADYAAAIIFRYAMLMPCFDAFAFRYFRFFFHFLRRFFADAALFSSSPIAFRHVLRRCRRYAIQALLMPRWRAICSYMTYIFIYAIQRHVRYAIFAWCMFYYYIFYFSPVWLLLIDYCRWCAATRYHADVFRCATMPLCFFCRHDARRAMRKRCHDAPWSLRFYARRWFLSSWLFSTPSLIFLHWLIFIPLDYFDTLWLISRFDAFSIAFRRCWYMPLHAMRASASCAARCYAMSAAHALRALLFSARCAAGAAAIITLRCYFARGMRARAKAWRAAALTMSATMHKRRVSAQKAALEMRQSRAAHALMMRVRMQPRAMPPGFLSCWCCSASVCVTGVPLPICDGCFRYTLFCCRISFTRFIFLHFDSIYAASIADCRYAIDIWCFDISMPMLVRFSLSLITPLLLLACRFRRWCYFADAISLFSRQRAPRLIASLRFRLRPMLPLFALMPRHYCWFLRGAMFFFFLSCFAAPCFTLTLMRWCLTRIK